MEAAHSQKEQPHTSVARSHVDLSALGDIPTVSWKKLTRQGDGGRDREERREKKEKKEEREAALGAPKESGDEASTRAPFALFPLRTGIARPERSPSSQHEPAPPLIPGHRR